MQNELNHQAESQNEFDKDIVDDMLEEKVLDEQQRATLKSWFQFCKTTKALLFTYIAADITLIEALIRKSLSLGGYQTWIVAILLVLNAGMTFILITLHLVIRHGKPNDQVKSNLLNLDDGESLATANNFYRFLIATFLRPTFLILLVLMLTQLPLFLGVKDFTHGLGGVYLNLTSATGAVFTGLTIVSILLLLKLNVFIGNARLKIDPKFFEESQADTSPTTIEKPQASAQGFGSEPNSLSAANDED